LSQNPNTWPNASGKGTSRSLSPLPITRTDLGRRPSTSRTSRQVASEGGRPEVGAAHAGDGKMAQQSAGSGAQGRIIGVLDDAQVAARPLRVHDQDRAFKVGFLH
jgi:hypothetical protein